MIALLAGCTFAPGGAFSTLEEVTLSGVSQLEETAHDEVLLSIDAVVLQELATAVAFDPTSPSPPFSLCHNGHCHHEDGSLWSYTEIEVWLAGSTATWEDAVVLDGGELDVLGGTLTLSEPVDLPRMSTQQLTLSVGAWWLDGVEQPEATLSGVVDLTVDRDLSPFVALDVAVLLTDGPVLTVAADVEER